MVPLALAVRDRGHEVAFATGKGFGPVVKRTGLIHFACGLDFDGSQDIFVELPEWKEIQASHPDSVAIQQVYGFVQGLAPRMAVDLIPLVDRWKPDVIIRDPIEYGGYIAAEAAGIPHATITWAIYIPSQHICPEAFRALQQQFGLPKDPELKTIDRYLVLNFLPHSWAFPESPANAVTYRFCAPPFDQSGDEQLPDWISSLPDQPTLHVTLGTTFNRSSRTFRAILEALSTEKMNVIMTVGRTVDPAQFQPLPDHIKIAQYIPQSLLLPRCDALLFHGGYNSLLAALWHGLPMVMTPLGAGDQLPNALRCQEQGAGLLVEGDPPDVEAVRKTVRTIFEDPAYRRRAKQLQQEIKALPSLSEAVNRLELLGKSH